MTTQKKKYKESLKTPDLSASVPVPSPELIAQIQATVTEELKEQECVKLTFNVKEMVSDNKRVKFIHYKLNELWYETETGFKFPIPIEDCGDATFPAEDKALLYMRYIRKHIAMLEQAVKESGYTAPYHVTGTDNPIDFPKCRCDKFGGALGGCPVHDAR